MHILLQRVADLTLPGASPQGSSGWVGGVTRVAQWAMNGSFWLVLLLVPGSLLLLPALIWWKRRRSR